MIRWGEVASAGVPGVAGSVAAALGRVPWYVAVLLACVGPVVYIYRLRVWLVLGRLALDKADASRIPEVMATITGNPVQPPAPGPTGSRGTPPGKGRDAQPGPADPQVHTRGPMPKRVGSARRR